jgi:hypothetical protein
VEPGIREYLIRIINTISLALLWMGINTTAGIMFDYAFIHEHISTGNIIFYIWFVVSLSLFLWRIIKIWSKPINFDE